jgi:dinuclear metal center YbgI/SA1388 family protein
MKVKDVTNYLESIAPLSLQESYDNSGLIIGDYQADINGVLLCLDVTQEVIDEAISCNSNLIIAHHPLIFSGINKITNNNMASKCVIKAIKNDINVYALHTNLDNVLEGVNGKIADVIGLKNRSVLSPKRNLNKITVITPTSHKEEVLNAMFESGAGNIGNYSNCSFSNEGLGTFKPLEGSTPYSGKLNEIKNSKEVKIELILPDHLINTVVNAMKKSHPYEEVAYDIIHLKNQSESGSGLIGELERPIEELDFLEKIKIKFKVESMKYTSLLNKPIKKVAVCGGSGSFLLRNAINKQADVFITSDFKYHQFFEADNRILVADIGHYESEQYTIDLIGDFLMKKFTNFAIRLTKIDTNPINYL